jgi:hypothetical protein
MPPVRSRQKFKMPQNTFAMEFPWRIHGLPPFVAGSSVEIDDDQEGNVVREVMGKCK